MKKIFLFALAALTLGFSGCVEDEPYAGISSVDTDKTQVTSADAVTVTAIVVNATSAQLIYTVDGGAEKTVEMSANGDTYTGVIPPQPEGSVVRYWVEANGAKSAENSYTVVGAVIDYSKLVLNEINGTGGDGDKYIELYNNGTVQVSLEGVTINYGTVGDIETSWTGEAGDVIVANGRFLIKGAKSDYPSLSTGLSAGKNVIVELYAPGGVELLDRLQRGPGDDSSATPTDMSMSRVPDGTGEWYFTTGTENAANQTSTNGLNPVPQGA